MRDTMIRYDDGTLVPVERASRQEIELILSQDDAQIEAGLTPPDRSARAVRERLEIELIARALDGRS